MNTHEVCHLELLLGNAEYTRISSHRQSHILPFGIKICCIVELLGAAGQLNSERMGLLESVKFRRFEITAEFIQNYY